MNDESPARGPDPADRIPPAPRPTAAPPTREPGAHGNIAPNATDERDLRIVAATLAGTLVACLFYGIDRTWAAWTSAPFDPDTVPATLRIDYFWRLSLAAFLGTTAAALAFLATEGRARRVTVRLGQLLLPALLFASLISVLWP